VNPPPATSSSSNTSSNNNDDGSVDPTKREAALSEAEFQEMFSMSKAEFYALKPWRQKQLKQEKGLW